MVHLNVNALVIQFELNLFVKTIIGTLLLLLQYLLLIKILPDRFLTAKNNFFCYKLLCDKMLKVSQGDLTELTLWTYYEVHSKMSEVILLSIACIESKICKQRRTFHFDYFLISCLPSGPYGS